jgi:hypothetical protein
LRTAEAVLDEPLFSNAKAACSLTWDAAVGVLTGWLALFGYRITSERGHLTAAIHGVGAILSEHAEGTKVVRKVDGLRRLRDNANYNNLPVDPAEVREYLPLVAQLGNWLERAAGNG